MPDLQKLEAELHSIMRTADSYATALWHMKDAAEAAITEAGLPFCVVITEELQLAFSFFDEVEKTAHTFPYFADAYRWWQDEGRHIAARNQKIAATVPHEKGMVIDGKVILNWENYV